MGSGDQARSDTDQQNIVLVTADSVRADHCGFMNPEIDTTPTLNSLAREGLVFENAIAPGPRTPSSIPVIWTGEYIAEENRGVYDTRETKRSNWQERRHRIRQHLDRFETTAERLNSWGYDTAGITMNPWTDYDTGFDQGFDHFEQIDRVPSDGTKTLFRRLIASTSHLPGVPDSRRWMLMWTDVYDTILEMRRKLSEPYFLWVFLMDAHQPYFAPREFREENNFFEMSYANFRYNFSYNPFEELPEHLEMRLTAAYRDAIRSIDAFVSQLLGNLSDDNPAFVFHADHGEAQLEHGTRGHRPELYDENLQVPLLANNVGLSGRIPEQVALRNLPEFLGTIVAGEASPKPLYESPLVATTEEKERTAVRTPEWKRIDSSESFDFACDSQLDELYNLGTDPDETDNFYESRRDVVDYCDEWLTRHSLTLEERERIAGAIEGIDFNTV